MEILASDKTGTLTLNRYARIVVGICLSQKLTLLPALEHPTHCQVIEQLNICIVPFFLRDMIWNCLSHMLPPLESHVTVAMIPAAF